MLTKKRDEETRIGDMKRVVASFVGERDWEQFHTPENLALSLSLEAAELLEGRGAIPVDQGPEHGSEAPRTVSPAAVACVVRRPVFAVVRRDREIANVRLDNTQIALRLPLGFAEHVGPLGHDVVQPVLFERHEHVLLFQVEQLVSFEVAVEKEHRRIGPHVADLEPENTNRLGVVVVTINKLEAHHEVK